MSKYRAKIAILSELMSFPTINQKDWDSWDLKPEVGDLVSLSSAPASKWYLGWVVEIRGLDDYPEYLLESIEDGSLCWWGNVGLNIYDRKRVSERVTWRWDDKQFAFNGRWLKVGRRNDAYIVLPCWAKFSDDGSVELNVRIRFGMNEFSYPRTFPNWKKTLMKDMDSYYKECCEVYEKRPPFKEAQ